MCLGGKEIDNELIGFLNVLFRWGGDREERKTVLKDEYGLKFSREVEKEWNKVMTYEGVWTKQIKEEGREEGRKEGREEGIVYATNLLLSTGMSTQSAIEMVAKRYNITIGKVSEILQKRKDIIEV